MSSRCRILAGFGISADRLPVIETRRLILRAPRLADADAIAESLGDFAVARMLARVPSPYFREDAVDWLTTLDEGIRAGGFAFAVTRDDVLIGAVGFDIRGGAVYFHYWLGRAYWRRGLMGEATSAVLDWYFQAAPNGVLRSGVFTDNPASLALQRKLGFVETGLSEIFCVARNCSQRHVKTMLDAARFRRSRTAVFAGADRGNVLTFKAGDCIDAALERGGRRTLFVPAETGCSP
ncbi:MAG TPA: GNAT family N-acetyltransferase [Pararhizobium sp.]|nr:GNAT family N-acetyltransferase [Pararhizobium sp.]